MLVSIPPKASVSYFMRYLKEKSSIMLYEQFGELITGIGIERIM